MTDAPDPDLLTLEPAPDSVDAPADATLQLDVAMVLVECQRDRRGDGVFRPDVSARRLEEFAALVARRLAPRIGGRYVPKRDIRAARDSQVLAAFKGANHQEVMREFKISRRLLYAILARGRRRAE